MKPEIDFQNSQKLPLHELTFTCKNDGVVLSIPALSKEWIEQQRPHIKYLPLHLRYLSDQFIEEWLIKNDWYNKNLQWLIELEYCRFWSNLIFEPACITSVVSFLQGAVPAYIPIKSFITDARVIDLYSKIMTNTLTILCRMVVGKESETEWMTKENLAKLLYENFLFSVPMIFDFFTVYGRSNGQIIEKLIGTVLRIQPKYKNDLKEGLSYLRNVFKTIQDKVNENDPDGFEDLSVYILDCAYTLNTLVNIVGPEACSICREIQLEQKVTKFYDDAIPSLQKNIKYIHSDSKALEYLNFARVELISFYRHLVNEFLQEALSDSKKQSSAERFLDMLQETLSENSFIADYQRLYPVEDDIEWLTNAYPDLDKFKLNFIKQAYTVENENFLETFVDRIEGATNDAAGASCNIHNTEGESSKPMNPKEKEVQSVLDVLPDLEVTFVRKLLNRYENPELAIAAVLEGNLPPDLDDSIEMDSPMDDKKSSVDLENASGAMAILDLAENTQIASKHIKSQAIKTKAERRFLDDKTHIKEFHARNIEYGYVDDDYDDEYDDSYDALTESETKTATKILRNTGAINEIVDEIDDSDESDDDGPNRTADSGSQQRDKSRDFCENSEAIRERWARNREAKFGNKRSTKPQTNLVGNARGQGQEKATLVGRKNKNENKSSRANHNRRQGAAFKRSRGMIPS